MTLVSIATSPTVETGNEGNETGNEFVSTRCDQKLPLKGAE
jgi:hypothetical protein